MTASTSILGSLSLGGDNIKVGAIRWFCAPYDTYIDETLKFDTNDIPQPWLDLGAAKQDSSLNFTKNFMKFMRGLPSVIIDKKVTSLDFTVQITLEQFSGANLSRAIYNTNYAIKNIKASPAIAQAVDSPIDFALEVTDSSVYAVGDYLALALTSLGVVTATEEALIDSIDGNTLVFLKPVNTVFDTAPYVGVIESWKVPFGSSRINKIALVGVWDEVVTATQFVIHIPRAVIDGNINGSLVPATDNQKIQLNVTGQGFTDTDLDDISTANLIRYAAQ